MSIPAQPLDWREFIETEIIPRWLPDTVSDPELRDLRLAVLHSAGLRKAFDGIPSLTVGDARIRVGKILLCLQVIRNVARFWNTPERLKDPIAFMRADRERAVEYLQKAASLLSLDEDSGRKYRAELDRLSARLLAEPYPATVEQMLAGIFDPKNLRRKGNARVGKSAFNGWMVRELARCVPENAPKRATAIAELLSIVAIDVEPPAVTLILKRNR